MCSERREEVVAVKSELFKAGIRSEIRENPLTAALQIKRLELWVQNERDFLVARKVYSRYQARARNTQDVIIAEDSAETPLLIEGMPAVATAAASERVVEPDDKSKRPGPDGELEEASMLLEREIEEVLKRQDVLAETCGALRSQVENLSRSLSDTQVVAEKKATDLATVRESLERQMNERARSEDQLKAEVRELQGRLKSSEQAVADRQKKLEAALQQLQTQQATVAQLRKEIAAREQEWDANSRMVSKTQADLTAERAARITAEEKAAKAAQAQERLEKQLAEQKEMEGRLRASVGNLNTLRGRLQAKRASVRS
jgi:DNA repair exonuclease SbcCD ATPase subunit